ncbi:MAG: replication-associated recombination protein A [Candidatus Zixiibacteriota bacterium]
MSLFDPQSSDTMSSAANAKPVAGVPLAERMRPRSVSEFVGQAGLMAVGIDGAPNAPLLQAIETDTVGSLIFWGPPGSGKTTLARIIARATSGQFVSFSAVTTSIKEVKALLSKAGNYRKLSGKRTFIFIDEIHRFNKAQQDAFLPYVESGDIVLLGATTENPSFEVNSALLSRCRVYTLERLTDQNLGEILDQALKDHSRGLGALNLTLDDDAREYLALAADGDARRLLSLLEAAALDAAETGGATGKLTGARVREIHQKGAALYDKSGEEHYNIISALHKTIRGGDPDAALYWLARMIDGGEEPLYILRRLIRFASEDIGLADPNALLLALAARDSYHMLGSPEGELAIAQLVIYLACAPKSNSAYGAWEKALALARESGSLPTPLDIRNAPTRLMKEIGYGKDYQYAHEYKDALTDQEYFPIELAGTQLYFPNEVGREKKLADYLKWYREEREKLRLKK